MELKNVLDKNTVVILPYANSIKELETEFWVRLADRLKERNIRVLTNVSENEREKAIEGTEPYQCSLKEIFVYAKEAYAVIGMRSGLMDWLACSGCNLICVEKFDAWGKYWDLNNISVRPVKYVEYNSGNIEASIEETLKKLF